MPVLKVISLIYLASSAGEFNSTSHYFDAHTHTFKPTVKIEQMVPIFEDKSDVDPCVPSAWYITKCVEA